MTKPFDVVALLSSAAMMSRKGASPYPPETQVIDLAELRQIIWDLQEERQREEA